MNRALFTGQVVVVLPVYEDRAAATRLLTELSVIDRSMYMVVVDDGSVTEPFEAGTLSAVGLEGEVLHLRRNVGHQRAIAIGLCHVAENIEHGGGVVVMDADGEDRPETVRELVECLANPDIDLAVAQRRSRVESVGFRWMYLGYKWMFETLVGHRIDFGNFMAMKPSGVARLTAMSELWIHIPACVIRSRLRMLRHAADRGGRYAGRSKMNFVGLALHGFRGLMVFSEDVLVRMGIACTLVALVSLTGGVTALVMKLAGQTTPGWATTVMGVLLVVFLQMGALTLMMLMLAGQTRTHAVAKGFYKDFIADRVRATGD